jgi:hypothetical protein
VSRGDVAHTARLGTADEILFDTSIARDVARLDIVAAVLTPFAPRLVWAPAVVIEMRLAKRFAGHVEEALALGREHDLTRDEEEAAEDLRSQYLTEAEIKRDPPLHLGEAQCVIICEGTPRRFVVHDGSGEQWSDERDVAHFTLIDVLAWLAATRQVRPSHAWRMYERMTANQGHADPRLRGMNHVIGWIASDDARRDAFYAFVSDLAAYLAAPAAP